MRRTVAVGTVLAAGLLAACSGEGSGPGKVAAGVPERQAGGAQAPAADRQPAASAPSAQHGEQAASEPVLPTAVIRTADLSVSVTGARNVAARADAAGDLAVRAGGEVDSDERTSGRDANATLRLRVPPTELQATLRDLSRLGRPTARHLSSRDVTKQVADVRSRVRSAERTIARLRDLYDRAEKVSDVLTIEDQLDDRETDLESLQAQQRALSAQTALATITLYLTTAPVHPKATPPHEKRTGFLGGLADGWDAFTGAAGAIATAVGAIVPFAVLVLLIAAIARLTWSRRRRTPGASAEPAS